MHIQHRVSLPSTKSQSAALGFALALFLMLFVTVGAAEAQHLGSDAHHTASTHHTSAYHVALFTGGTAVKGHTAFTLGGELEYRLPVWHQRIGVAALVDATLGEHATTIAGGALTVRPLPAVSNVKFVLAPSAEFKDGHSMFLMRTGIGVDFHAGSLSVTPAANLDFVDGHVAKVFGLHFGVGL
jgi:hypothetical protein